ncbi:hypothetical protein BC831DRAFT_449560 [Entophlyctis helioformis]|nr:hypothetical protein BC831DRAFT_449560 [Entophlyctis helioformis]
MSQAPASDFVVLVTGASRGIGLAVTESLLRQGAKVLGTGRTPLSKLPDIQRLQAEFPSSLHYVVADLAAPGGVGAKAAYDACMAVYESVDAIVHNAGILEPMARLANVDLAAWRSLMDVNVFAGVELAQLALPQMRLRTSRAAANDGGYRAKFIVVSSGAATGAKEGWAPYCVSKAAANMIVQGLGIEEPLITSVAVRPGVVDTEMQQEIRDKGREPMGADFHTKFVHMKEAGQLLDPMLPGTAIANLALRAPADLSGQFINWDDARCQI